MTIQERFWEKPYQETEAIPETNKPIPLGIFIDDVDTFAEAWERCFHIPGFATMRPEIPDDFNDDTKDEITEKIEKFIGEITDKQLERASVLVIDQFYDNFPLLYAARDLVTRLRAVNKTAVIVETSGLPDEPLYEDTNSVLWTALEAFDARDLIQHSPPLPFARIQAFNLYTRPAFIYSGLADPALKHDKFDKKEARERSFGRLRLTDEYKQIKEAFGVDSDNFFPQQFSVLTDEQQKLFLHYAWNIVGHLQIQNGAEYFGGSLMRLKKLLKPEE